MSAMIVKTIATNHQLEIRKSSPTRPTSTAEKSYLRSQFERRQKRQIELTNKMDQQAITPARQNQRSQPDSVVTSHELIKKRFFDELERRESLNVARGAIKPNELKQVGRHDQYRLPQTVLAGNRDAGGARSAKVGAINEADGAGTDADEATSLETIITNNCKSNGTFVASATGPDHLCTDDAAAHTRPSPSVDFKINDGQQVGESECTSTDGHDQAQDDVSSGGEFKLQEALECEQGPAEWSASVQQQKRQPSKRDLHDGRPLDAAAEDEHERLRLLRLGQHEHDQQQQQQREQYANPRSRLSDNSQGSHDESELERANNVNHDQTDGCARGDLAYMLHAQVFAVGMQFEGEGGLKGERARVVNLMDGSQSLSGHDLIKPLRHEAGDSKMFPNSKPNKISSSSNSSQQPADCDTAQARHAIMMSSPTEKGAPEEDVRSSCSSSGFGASGSAGSSSSSSSDGHQLDHRRHHLSTNDAESISLRGCVQNDHYRRPSAVRGNSRQPGEQIEMAAHEIAQFEIVVGKQDNAASIEACNLSVGPNQAYPRDTGRPFLHVENHGYGSLVSAPVAAANSITGPTVRNQVDRRRWPLVNAGDVSSELDLYSNRQYVNLPAGSTADSDIQDSSSAIVGYATVRTQSLKIQDSRGRAGSANIPSTANENNGHSQVSLANQHSSQRRPAALNLEFQQSACEFSSGKLLEDCRSNSSEHDSSTSSANTGGFSKLPPVRLINHHFANDFKTSNAPFKREPLPPRPISPQLEGSNSMQHQQQSKKSPSLLKRFGSLVSRAFTSNSVGGGDDGGSNLNGHYGDGLADSNGPARFEVSHSGLEAAAPPLSLQQQQQLQQRKSCLHELGNDNAGPSGRHKSAEEPTVCNLSRTSQEMRLPMQADKANRKQQLGSAISTSDPVKQCSATGSKNNIRNMAQADLVILTTKHTKNNHLATRGKNREVAATDDEIVHRAYRNPHRRDTSQFAKNYRLRSGVNDHPQATHMVDANRRATHERTSGATRCRRSSSGSTCSSITSLDESSSVLTSCSSTQDLTRKRATLGAKRRHRGALRRTSSLSDELESLMSRSEVESPQKRAVKLERLAVASEKCDKKRVELLSQRRRSIAAVVNHDNQESHAEEKTRNSLDNNKSKSRSIMKWFNATTAASLASSSPSPQRYSRDDCHIIRYDPTGWAGESARDSHSRREPRSLIDRSHASSDCKLDSAARNLCPQTSKLSDRASRAQPTSLIYTSANEDASKYSRQRKRSDDDITSSGKRHTITNDELVVSDGKCQSLNLYQNLLRNYVKRRGSGNHHQRHHHHHHHHHGHHNRSHHHHAHAHHHNNKHSSSSRHAHCSSAALTATTRCGRSGSPTSRVCLHSGDRLAGDAGVKTNVERASVWGQLIKINKTDGSQVIELERAPGKSWGFFVARGSINNRKGIFISRMHDSSTGSSLSGLLSIGDQILSIDGYTIEPDFDILRVNQLISKKGKISLGVKPFKG